MSDIVIDSDAGDALTLADKIDAAIDASIVPANPPLSVLVAVPTRGYVWHETASALAPYNAQYVREKLSVASVRNKIVREFLKTEADALVMVDDDVIPPPKFVELLAMCPYDIVGAPVPIAKMPAHEVFLNAFDFHEDGSIHTTPLDFTIPHKQVGAVGTGVILIHRRVLEHEALKRPFDQQLDDDGVILVGQDLRFCKRAGDAGFTVGLSFQVECDHFVWLHANAIHRAYHPIPEIEPEAA